MHLIRFFLLSVVFIDVLYSVFNLVNSTKDTTSPFASLVVRAIPPSFDPSPTPMMELDDPSEEDTESFTPTPAVHSSVMQNPVSVSQDDPAVRTTEEESVHHPTPSTQPEKAPVANNPKTSLFESKLKGSSSEVTVRNVENKLQRKWTVIGVKPNRGNVVERKRWSIAEVKPNPDAASQTKLIPMFSSVVQVTHPKPKPSFTQAVAKLRSTTTTTKRRTAMSSILSKRGFVSPSEKRAKVVKAKRSTKNYPFYALPASYDQPTGEDSQNPVLRADFMYKQYVRRRCLVRRPQQEYLLYDRMIFSRMTKYDFAHRPQATCRNAREITAYFDDNIEKLFVSCKDGGIFSHCQPFFLFQYSSISQRCQPFERQPYVDSPNVVNTTLTTQFSYHRLRRLTHRLNRFNRFPFILQRWPGYVSVAIFVKQSEVPALAEKMAQFAAERRVIYTVYVQKTIDPENPPFYMMPNKEKRLYPKGLYPLNILRDLAIESIHTTHFFMIDADVFLSKTLYANLRKYANLLTNHKVVMFIPLFEYANSAALQRCYNTNDCDQLWKQIPTVKEDLRIRYNKRQIVQFGKKYHDITPIQPWLRNEDSRPIPSRFFEFMEPYGVFSRSMYDPFYHPYFIDYGGDKQEYFIRMYNVGSGRARRR
ncbi:hypothetical protein BLSTO_02654 [Blastocystis sp. subtype 1]